MDVWRLAHVLVTLQIAQGIPNASEEEYEDLFAGADRDVANHIVDRHIEMNDPADREEESDEEDPNWDVNIAVKDVAYYLRAHKFSDYDRRYFRHINEATSRLWEEFPKPALRSLHWEVQSHCDGGFVLCLKYLHSRVLETPLQRKDDTLVIIRNNKWTMDNFQQISAVNRECKTALARDNETFDPFHGPIERFQWRTTASYYMCWFTMLGRPELRTFHEDCDDFAECSDTFHSNHDPRAIDDNAFACAMYSFCPDPCCPLKHAAQPLDCSKSPLNPCAGIKGIEYQWCKFKREDNQDFLSLISNQLNVSCSCGDPGYEWSSRFGQCVDVNECTAGYHTCNIGPGAVCINLPGSSECVCQFGYIYNDEVGNCDPNPKVKTFLSQVITHSGNATTESTVNSIVKLLTQSSAVCSNYCHIILIISLLCSL